MRGILLGAVLTLAIAGTAAARPLVTAGPARFQESIGDRAGAHITWTGLGGLKVTVGENPAGALTLSCQGHGIAHLRILAHRRTAARATCTGRDTQPRTILQRAPAAFTLAGTISRTAG